jgi:hypothetical protein
MAAVIPLVFIKDPYSQRKITSQKWVLFSSLGGEVCNSFFSSSFHVNLQHSRHRLTHLPLKMKIGLKFCNIVALTYRSRMQVEVQKCLNH